MSDFYRKLNEREIVTRNERIFANRPANLHDYQGCTNDPSMMQQQPQAIASQPAHQERHEFENFHRNLCERFGYPHDPVDWKRDQISLIEHIAAKLDEALGSVTDEEVNGFASVIGIPTNKRTAFMGALDWLLASRHARLLPQAKKDPAVEAVKGILLIDNPFDVNIVTAKIVAAVREADRGKK